MAFPTFEYRDSFHLGFLDHVLRQGPSERMILIKRVFFNEYSETKRLNSYSEAIKGIYSAIRLNEVRMATWIARLPL